MSEQVLNFIKFLDRNDIGPAQGASIIGDDEQHYYQIEGDTRTEKRGSYQLKVGDDFAYGWARDHRVGQTYKYSSRARSEWTPEKKLAFKKENEDRRAKQDKDDREKWEKAASEAKLRWDAAAPCSQHPYLIKKQCGHHALKVDGDLLLIPSYGDNKLWGIQTIDSEGNKRFSTGSKKEGCYSPLAAADDNKDVIVICEGWATGASIREATGLVVVVAFDCGNLESVAAAMRNKYPDAKIIIASDNDAFRFNPKHRIKDLKTKELPGDDPRWQEWRERGLLENLGVKKGKEVAFRVRGHELHPVFHDADLVGKPNDWNDFYCLYGKEKLKEFFDIVVNAAAIPQNPPAASADGVEDNSTVGTPPSWWEEQAPPLDAYEEEVSAAIALYGGKDTAAWGEDKNWQEKLIYTKDKIPKLSPKSLTNISLFLSNAPAFNGMFCYDEFAHEKLVIQCPPWENPANFYPRALNDDDVTQLAMMFEDRGLIPGLDNLRKVLSAVLMKRRKNPAKEYLNGLKWDGTRRIHYWLKHYAGADEERDDYLEMIGTKWLVGAVNRVLQPGCKFDHMLVFEGGQGERKSTLLGELATIHGKKYFDDTIKITDLGLEKTVPKLQGVLIIELQEMSGIRKADMESFKAQITIKEDRLVRKYANEATRFPRQFVFAGTINITAGYLDDPTGNRRIFPVKSGRKIDIEGIKRDKEQLWAEAVHLYHEEYRIWLNEDEMKLLAAVQENRKVIHPWLPDLEVLSQNKNFVSSRDIWSALGFETFRKNSRDSSTISKIMTELGFTYGRKTINNEREYGWSRKVFEVDVEF